MTSGFGPSKARVALRLDTLLHRLIAPIVAGLSVLAFLVLSIGSASLAPHPGRHEGNRPTSSSPGTAPHAAPGAGRAHAEASARSR